ncbi:MAG: UTP--glucose-1-phosphate uridylyltransferase GalU [Acidimicrobiales bacterium]
MTTPVHKAVIPAAGLGTRFLPASKAQAKEMVPVVDKPAIQYVVEEAARAGITDILVVTGRGKRSLEDHFDRSIELELELERKGKVAELKQVRAISDLAVMHYVRQAEAKGLGHAVGVARPHVGTDSFAVMLGDDIMDENSHVLEEMLAVHERYGRSVVALKEVPRSEVSMYGCAGAEPVEDSLVRIMDIVEKPAPADAPSNLAVMGRYVFTAEIFEALDQVQPGSGGEIQLTDAIALLTKDQAVYGYVFEEGRYDIGNKLGYLKATVELALEREDIGEEFRAFLVDLVQRRRLV